MLSEIQIPALFSSGETTEETDHTGDGNTDGSVENDREDWTTNPSIKQSASQPTQRNTAKLGRAGRINTLPDVKETTTVSESNECKE